MKINGSNNRTFELKIATQLKRTRRERRVLFYEQKTPIVMGKKILDLAQFLQQGARLVDIGKLAKLLSKIFHWGIDCEYPTTKRPVLVQAKAY